MSKIVVLLSFLLLISGCGNKLEYKTIDGFTQGTTYHIVYSINSPDSLNAVVDKVLAGIDNSLSVYNDSSIISRINRGEDISPDSLFVVVFNRSAEIYNISKGAFDISGAPMFDVWGFGFKNKEKVTQGDIDSIKQFVGMDKVKIENGKVVKADPRLSLNANAIAQGYTSDVIAREFDKLGIMNYMIEVGGEIFCKGVNPKGIEWSVGIDKPIEGNVIPGEELQEILSLSEKGLATSGNYRKFYEENGKKYAHTIDPRTGYPVTHSLLSATVIAVDAMTADALATYFMVVGLDEAKAYLAANTDVDAYLVYSEGDSFQVYKTSGIKTVKLK
ncbi:MAG: FAD:protein FMN transferase [Bacteroidales bacterium]|nr:FAD:protein FMN transferase [Bacteroidales bacterium]